MEYLSSLLLSGKQYDIKTILLYRFHLVLIVVNIIAVLIDTSANRIANAWIETGVTLLLLVNIWYLLQTKRLKIAALFFLLIVTTALFIQIGISHFGTMSVVFVLLLPLTIMPFIPMRYAFFIEVSMMAVMGLMLYREYLTNPSNPIIQNPKALFHLGYTAAIIYIFGLLYHFSILKTFNELDASNRQKALLLKEVYHRVKNNLNIIASMIGLQTASLGDQEKEHLLKSKVRIESIAIVHEMLYRSDDLESIDFKAYTSRLTTLLISMYNYPNYIDISIQTTVKTLSLETMVQLGIMINELITNSIKYAFGNDGAGKIELTLTKEGNHYRLTYTDNGNGMDMHDHSKKKNSLGIKLIHLTAKQLQGNVSIKHNNGLTYIIRFKDGKDTCIDC